MIGTGPSHVLALTYMGRTDYAAAGTFASAITRARNSGSGFATPHAADDALKSASKPAANCLWRCCDG